MVGPRIAAAVAAAFAAAYAALSIAAAAAPTAPTGPASVSQSVGDPTLAMLVSRLEAIDYYTDRTESELMAVGSDGTVFHNRNSYRTVFDREAGALIDGYLGQAFVIEDWTSVTNEIKHAARHTKSDLAAGVDWRDLFVPLGGMMSSEHPMLSLLLDRATGRTATGLPAVRRYGEPRAVQFDGKPAFLIEAEVGFESQGMNFGAGATSDLVSARFWIDGGSGLLARIEYDVTAAYVAAFGPVESARLTVRHLDVSTERPEPATVRALLHAAGPTSSTLRPVAGLFTAAPTAAEDDGSIGYLLGRPAPRIRGKTMSGADFDLSRLRGRPVVLFFWASWCPNCARVVREIEALAATESVSVIGINADNEAGDATLRRYYARHELTFESVLDPDHEFASRYRVVGIPTTFVVDEQGVLGEVVVGLHESFREHLMELLGIVDA